MERTAPVKSLLIAQMLHTFAIYQKFDHVADETSMKAQRGMLASISSHYACSLCRGHFQKLFSDPIVQQELHEVKKNYQVSLWLWKGAPLLNIRDQEVHNIVTNEQHAEKPLFPQSHDSKAPDLLVRSLYQVEIDPRGPDLL